MPRYKEHYLVIYVPLSGDTEGEYARFEKLILDIDPEAKRLQESIWTLRAWDKSVEAIGGRLRYDLKMIWRREKLPPLNVELTCAKHIGFTCSRTLELPLKP